MILNVIENYGRKAFTKGDGQIGSIQNVLVDDLTNNTKRLMKLWNSNDIDFTVDIKIQLKTFKLVTETYNDKTNENIHVQSRDDLVYPFEFQGKLEDHLNQPLTFFCKNCSQPIHLKYE